MWGHVYFGSIDASASNLLVYLTLMIRCDQNRAVGSFKTAGRITAFSNEPSPVGPNQILDGVDRVLFRCN